MSSSDIIASAAVIIALLSLFVTIFEVRQSRFHGRASVRPVLQLSWSNPGQSTSNPTPTVGLMLKNVGLGPAIVYETRVFVDGRHIGRYNRENANRIANDLKKETGISSISKDTFGDGDFVIEVNYLRFIFSIQEFKEDQRLGFVNFLLNRLSIIFYYRSLYGEEAKAIFGQQHLQSDQI